MAGEPEAQQRSFSGVFFDTLFSLVIFLSFESLFSIDRPFQVFHYLFTLLVVIHWWLLFKSADDRFSTEVTDSILDIILGIGYLILLGLIVLTAKTGDLSDTILVLLGLFAIDLIWAFIWRYIGTWQTHDLAKRRGMEQELTRMLHINTIFFFGLLVLFALAPLFTPVPLLCVMAVLYGIYAVFSHKKKILNIDWF